MDGTLAVVWSDPLLRAGPVSSMLLWVSGLLGFSKQFLFRRQPFVGTHHGVSFSATETWRQCGYIVWDPFKQSSDCSISSWVWGPVSANGQKQVWLPSLNVYLRVRSCQCLSPLAVIGKRSTRTQTSLDNDFHPQTSGTQPWGLCAKSPSFWQVWLLLQTSLQLLHTYFFYWTLTEVDKWSLRLWMERSFSPSDNELQMWKGTLLLQHLTARKAWL